MQDQRVRLFIIGLLFYSSSCLAQAQQGEVLFNQGMRAFNAQNYQEALDFFQQAQQLGLINKRLPYNIGVTLYKLGEYQAAYQSLKNATSDNDLAAIAYLNMGLAALKMNNTELAKQNFQLSTKHANNNEQRLLAQRLLNQIGVTPQHSLNYHATGSLSAGLGYNDNVTLNATEELAQKSEQSDAYTSLYGKLNQSFSASLFSDVSIYSLQYADLNDYNYANLSANLYYKKSIADFILKVTADAQFVFLDNIRIQNLQLAEFEMDFPLNATTTLATRYQFSNIDATDQEYGHLDGNRQRLRLAGKFTRPASKLQLFYEYETNDRNDASDNTASFSPRRNKLGIKHNIHLTPMIGFQWGLQYRSSDFPDSDQTDTSSDKRQDNRSRANLRYMQRLSKRIWCFIDYHYLDNESNIDEYDYQSNSISINLFWNNR